MTGAVGTEILSPPMVGPFPSRPVEELVQRLREHVDLLREFAKSAFVKKDAKYAGEVAGKLRVLVTEFGSNKPLLLRLMKETGIEPKIKIHGPPVQGSLAGKEVTLAEYMGDEGCGARTPSGKFQMFSNVELVRAWAEQRGAAHEDWSQKEPLTSLLGVPVFVGGQQATLVQLGMVAKIVLKVADRFLQEYSRRVSAPPPGTTGDKSSDMA